MASWTFTPTSVNGRAIVGGSIAQAFFLIENGPLFTRKYAPVSATVTGAASQDVRGQPQPTTWRLRNTLSGVDETDKAALQAMFNEAEGLVYLRITDGAGVVWRCAVRVTGIEPVNVLQFDAVLFVPDPTWEEDSLTTDQQLNKTASPITIAQSTNNGTRECHPKFTAYATVAKGIASILEDRVYSLRSWLVNTSPKPINNQPVWLFDQSGAQARLATDSGGAAAATVKQTVGATTIAADIAAGAATITLTSAASWPSAGIGFATDTRGAGFHDQFYYTSIAGNVLQGVVWLRAASNGADPYLAPQTAGGIAHTMAQISSICPSGILLSGDDVRVAYDDDPNIDRWLVNWNSTASDVCILATLPEAIKLTLTSPMTASVPGVGGLLSFVEGVSKLAPDGFLAIGNEIVHYSAKQGNGVILDGARGLWDTTAASHATTVPVYANPHRVVVSCGYAKADVAPSPPEKRPACQLKASQNAFLKWGDTADDPGTVFHDPAYPDRALSWKPTLDTELDPLLSGSTLLTAAVASMTFQDSLRSSVQGTPANSLAVMIAQKIQTGANKVNVTATLDPALVLDVFGTALGTEMLLKELAGSVASTIYGMPSTSNLNGQLRIAARHGVITGTATGDYAEVTATDVLPLAQTFTFDGQKVITRLAVRCRQGVGNMLVDLVAVNDDGTLDITNKLMAQATVLNANIPVAMGWVFIDLSSSPITMGAGKYALLVTAATAGTGTVILSRSNGSVYASGEARAGVIGSLTKTYACGYNAWADAGGGGDLAPASFLFFQGSGAPPLSVAVMRFDISSSVPVQAIRSINVSGQSQSGGTTGANMKLWAYAASGATNYGQDDPALDSLATVLAKSSETTGRAYQSSPTFISAVDATAYSDTLALDASPADGTPDVVTDARIAIAGFGRFSVAVTPSPISVNGNSKMGSRLNGTAAKRPVMNITYSEAPTSSFKTILPFDLGIRVYGSPQQADSVSNTGGQSLVTAVSVFVDTAGYVYVHRNAGFVTGAAGGALFHLPGVLANSTSGDQIGIDKWLKLGASNDLVIDCDANTVIYTEDGVAYPLQKCIAPLDLRNWFGLLPGANVVTYTDVSLVSGTMSIVTTFRGKRT